MSDESSLQSEREDEAEEESIDDEQLLRGLFLKDSQAASAD